MILFLDDDAHRAALMYQRMSNEDRNRTVWVETAEDAIQFLKDYKKDLVKVYLDHDLGGQQFVHSQREDCGMEVVRWLEKQDSLDYKECQFVVHSWNIEAAKVMTDRLLKVGYNVTQTPFGR